VNIREDAAKYYDIQSIPIDDVAFYRARIPSPEARVLELGCGTGRVLVPLASECGFIHGIDSSAAMLAQCREKLDRAGLPAGKAQVTHGDITDIYVDGRFDLIIAPFRVVQNLETDVQVSGLMYGIRRHLAPGGTAILNAFHPNRPPEEMRKTWCTSDEHLDGETALPDGGRLVRSHRRPCLQSDPLVCYPELIYRQYAASGALEDEAVLKIAMRCWYPAELEKMVADHGFRTTGRWGGYQGEVWGEGPELVIQFESLAMAAASAGSSSAST
jgi:SAM-dependent methyltransferase